MQQNQGVTANKNTESYQNNQKNQEGTALALTQSPITLSLQSVQITQKQASDLFYKCKYEQAQNLLDKCIVQLQKHIPPTDRSNTLDNVSKTQTTKVTIRYMDLLLNKASLLMAINKYQQALLIAQKCSQTFVQFKKMNQAVEYESKAQLYCLKINCLIKLKREKQGKQLSQTALEQFPYHKKLKQLAKLAKQKTITENEQSYMDHMFQKLCLHPKVRQYLKEEGFLTKVQRMIRNPSLTPALSKIDPRIKEASDALMMADEDWQ